MIVGTPHDPALAFIGFVRAFVGALSRGDFGKALERIDENDDGTRWSKTLVQAALRALTDLNVTTPDGQMKSARPSCGAVQYPDQFEVTHRLPLDGKWSDVAAVFRFTRNHGWYFRAQFLGFVRIAA